MKIRKVSGVLRRMLDNMDERSLAKTYNRMMAELRLPRVTEPEEMEFYSIEPDGRGGKQIHILGYTYASDNNTEDYWRLTEGTFMIVPLQEFIDHLKQDEDYVDNLWCDAKQYEGDYTDAQVVDIINNYFDGHTANRRLHYSEITIDTPCGDYIA